MKQEYRTEQLAEMYAVALDKIDFLREALREIADEKPWPGYGEELQEIARRALTALEGPTP